MDFIYLSRYIPQNPPLAPSIDLSVEQHEIICKPNKCLSIQCPYRLRATSCTPTTCRFDDCQNRSVYNLYTYGKSYEDQFTQVKEIKYKHFGLFAAKNLTKNEVVGLYTGEYVQDDDYVNTGYDFELSDESGNQLGTVRAKKFGTNTRFANHSCAPIHQIYFSIYYLPLPDNEEKRLPLIRAAALHDIEKGAQLTFNYGWVRDQYSDFPYTLCFCSQHLHFIEKTKPTKTERVNFEPTIKVSDANLNLSDCLKILNLVQEKFSVAKFEISYASSPHKRIIYAFKTSKP